MIRTTNQNYVALRWERCVYPVHANCIAYLWQKISIAVHFGPREKESDINLFNIERKPYTRNA